MTTFNFTRQKISNDSVRLFNPLKQDKTHRSWLIYVPGMDGRGELLHTQIRGLAPYFNLRCLSISSTDLSNWEQLTTATINCLKSELAQINADRVYLCGESFGGCLAMSVATTVPQLFSGMILVNPASCFNQQPLLGWGINLTRLIPDWLHSNSAVGLLPFLAELSRIKQSDRRVLLEAMKSLPQQVVSWRLSLLQSFTLNPSRCDQFKQPTLIVASSCDRLLPSVQEASKLISLFPNSAMEILPRSGHACLLETETNLAKILERHHFLITE